MGPNERNSKINNKIYPQGLLVESEKLSKIRKTRFYLIINNKKTNEFYSKNSFLNEFNHVITEKSINNSLNAKIFIQKTETLINNNDNLEKLIITQKNKIIENNSLFSSQSAKQLVFNNYYKNIYKNKTKIKKYKENIKSMTIKKINYKFKCIICKGLRENIFNTREFEEIILPKERKKTIKRLQSLNQYNKTNNEVRSLSRVKTFIPKKVSFKSYIEDGFELKKTENNINLELKWRNAPTNLIIIHNFILKSLPYYKEITTKEIIKIDNNIENINNNINNNKFKYKSINRSISRKFGVKGLHSFQHLLLKAKKNSFVDNHRSEKDLLFGGQSLIRKAATIKKIENFRHSYGRQLSQKSTDSNYENISILKHKKFFKKSKINDITNIQNEKRKAIINSEEYNYILKNNIKQKKDEKDIEEIYSELVKLIMEGKNKLFQSYFEANRKYIDINQEIYEGNTLLILCAKEGNYFITKFLCDENAEVNIQDYNGNTALHFAIGKQFYALADVLTRHGAREDIKNFRGFTPWDCIAHNIE